MRAALYLSIGLGTALVSMVVLSTLMVSVALIGAAGAGLVVLPVNLALVRRWADQERRRTGGFLGRAIPARYRPLPSGFGERLRATLLDPVTLRELAWLGWHIVMGVLLGLFGMVALVGVPSTLLQTALWWMAPDGEPATLALRSVTDWPTALLYGAVQFVVLAALLLWGVAPLARLHATVAAALLGRSRAAQLAERVETLSHTRAGALDAHAAELRRIERDLHDGTQARLVALAMRLGLARSRMGEDPEQAARLLAEAQSGAEEAMTELRQVIRTIYPPVLSDRGLVGAVEALAARSVVPATVSVDDLGAVPASVEATAYHLVAEALTNVAKHAEASRAEISLSRIGGWLRIAVTDDGRGGVAEDGGTGVGGMRRRVAALDGEFTVVSPVGGPTRVEALLPCGS
ncbi:sensor histidine kinase [Streptomonospora sp. NEAU-YY374]|nr:sensor histidine kinase [Streptomonospora nanhaiensis]MBX9387408.1 sensor histidine kinase [Streptomonospora nanhaiensis]